MGLLTTLLLGVNIIMELADKWCWGVFWFFFWLLGYLVASGALVRVRLIPDHFVD